MAKQTGAIKIEGSIDGICFYKMEGQYFARSRTSLSGKRFRKDKAFAGSRESAAKLGEAAKMASLFYKRLPAERKGRIVFQKLTGKIKLLLTAGYDEKYIEVWFCENYLSNRHINDLQKQDLNLKTSWLPKRKIENKAA